MSEGKRALKASESDQPVFPSFGTEKLRMPICRACSTISGILLGISPLPLVLLLNPSSPMENSGWNGPVAFALAACLFGGGVLVGRNHAAGRILASIGTLGSLLLMVDILTISPASALTVLIPAALLLYALWTSPLIKHQAPPADRSFRLSARARGACLSLVGVWLLITLTGRETEPAGDLLGLAFGYLVVVFCLFDWIARCGLRYRLRAGFLLLAGAMALGAIVLFWGSWWSALSSCMVFPVTVILTLPFTRITNGAGLEEWWDLVLDRPERLLASTFVVLCLAGTALLALPACASPGRSISLADAAFTAVSAVCVTGLIVLDTPVDFSLVGQCVILALIQLGGLGIMTISTVALELLGRRMSLRHEGVAAGLFSLEDRSRVFSSAHRILRLTFVCEAAGAVLLAVRFLLHGDGLSQAVWRGCFTAVSAFCNAGFALQSSNLIPYQSDPWVLHAVAVLIILGGLSPIVVLALPSFLIRGEHPLRVQTALVLVSTTCLLLLGFVLILAFEWSNAFSHMGILERCHNAWFQSVTTRTAGFNSVDTGALRPATLTLIVVLMFIGGSPGGTAGGIKNTTMSILLLSVLGAVRGQWSVIVFGRTISHRTVYKAAAILTGGVAAVFLALLGFQITQVIATPKAVFEVVSALGTVGLSIGATTHLDGIGKGIIMVCMFAGRVGPLTLFMFLSQQEQLSTWRYPETEIDVG